jgi:allantoate deiminase
VLSELLGKSIKASGLECLSLVSGAGHDAVPVSEIAPVCMLFVRCFKGISHNPMEDVEIKDIAAGLKVSERFLNELIQYNQNY